MPEPETNDPLSNSTAPDDPAVENAAEAAAKGGKTASTAEAGGPAVAGPVADLIAAKAEAAANLDRYLRVAADLENFRRRTVREKDELRTVVTSRVLEDVYPVLDTLGLALAAAKQPGADLKSLVGGIEMVLTQLKTALAGHGLKEINPMGQAFDPHQHEAISHLPSPEVKEEHVLTVVRTGYSLNGRLLRPASVVVSSGNTKGDKK